MAEEYQSGSTVATVSGLAQQTLTHTTTAAGAILAVTGYSRYAYQVVRSSGAGEGTYMIEGSLDGTNFFDMLDDAEVTVAGINNGWIVNRQVLFIRVNFSGVGASEFDVDIIGVV